MKFNQKLFSFILILSLGILFSYMFIQSTNASGTGDWPPPTATQWVVDVETVVENEIFTLNASVEVQATGLLILKNCNITMNSSSSHGEVHIDVLTGGNLTILDCTFNAADKYTWYIDTEEETFVRIEDSEFIGARDPSYTKPLIDLDGANSIFRNNIVHNNTRGGIHMGTNANNSVVSDNYCYNIQEYAIWVSWNYHSLIENNVIENVDEWGMSIYGTENATIRNNNLTRCGYGLWTTASNNYTLDSNIVTDCRSYSIYLGSSTNGTIINNQVINPGAFAYETTYAQSQWTNNFVDGEEVIRLYQVNNQYIEENITAYPNGIGELILVECSDLDISQISGNSIHILESSEIMVHKNVLSTGGIYSKNSDNIVITNNTVIESGTVAMMNHFSTYMSIKKNIIEDAYSAGISLQGGSNSEIIGNTITNCSTGINLSGGSQQTIALNYIEESRFRGAVLGNSDSHFYSNYLENNQYSLDVQGTNLYIHRNAFINPIIDQGEAIFASNLQMYYNLVGNLWSDHTGFGPYNFDGYDDLYPIQTLSEFWDYFYDSYNILDLDPPQIEITYITEDISQLTSVEIIAEIEDFLALDEVTLGYSLDNQLTWTNVSMFLLPNGSYSGSIPAGIPANIQVYYQITAVDLAGNVGTSAIESFEVVPIDDIAPIINTYYLPNNPVQGENIEIVALIEDNSDIAHVRIHILLEGETSWFVTHMIESGWHKWKYDLVITDLGSQPFIYYVSATDINDNTANSTMEIVFVKSSSQAFFDNPITTISISALSGALLLGIIYVIIKIITRKS